MTEARQRRIITQAKAMFHANTTMKGKIATMKNIISAALGIALLTAGFVANAAVQANDKDTTDYARSEKSCRKQADSLPEKITKLKIELAKGDNTYSGRELQKLESDLKQAQYDLRALTKPGK